MFEDLVFLDDSAAQNVLLKDALEHRRITAAVPNTLWINQSDWPVTADSKTVRLRPKDLPRATYAQFFETLLEIDPSRTRALEIATLRLALIGAQKDVVLSIFDPNKLDLFTNFLKHFRVI